MNKSSRGTHKAVKEWEILRLSATHLLLSFSHYVASFAHRIDFVRHTVAAVWIYTIIAVWVCAYEILFPKSRVPWDSHQIATRRVRDVCNVSVLCELHTHTHAHKSRMFHCTSERWYCRIRLMTLCWLWLNRTNDVLFDKKSNFVSRKKNEASKKQFKRTQIRQKEQCHRNVIKTRSWREKTTHWDWLHSLFFFALSFDAGSKNRFK